MIYLNRSFQLSNIRKLSHFFVKTFEMTKMFSICITFEKFIWKIERFWQIEIEMIEKRLSCFYSKFVCFRDKTLTCCNKLLQTSCEFMFYEIIIKIQNMSCEWAQTNLTIRIEILNDRMQLTNSLSKWLIRLNRLKNSNRCV